MVIADLTLAPLAQGEYVIEVTAEQGRQEGKRDVRVQAGALAEFGVHSYQFKVSVHGFELLTTSGRQLSRQHVLRTLNLLTLNFMILPSANRSLHGFSTDPSVPTIPSRSSTLTGGSVRAGGPA